MKYSKLQTAFREEMAQARAAWEVRNLAAAFRHLENAHVLGQRRLLPHAQVHAWMLRVGWAQRDLREILGQLLRLALTPLGHLTGRLPLGNTGGANVSAFKPMPIREDYQTLFEDEERA